MCPPENASPRRSDCTPRSRIMNEAPLVALLITGHQATHGLIASFEECLGHAPSTGIDRWNDGAEGATHDSRVPESGWPLRFLFIPDKSAWPRLSVLRKCAEGTVDPAEQLAVRPGLTRGR